MKLMREDMVSLVCSVKRRLQSLTLLKVSRKWLEMLLSLAKMSDERLMLEKRKR